MYNFTPIIHQCYNHINVILNKKMQKTKKTNKTKILIAVFILLLVTGVVGVYSYVGQDNPAKPLAAGEINYSPPTGEEKAAGDKKKKELVEEQTNREKGGPSSTTGKVKVNVIITDAAQYDNVIEVRAFTQNYYEDGTCIIKFTKDTAVVSKSTPAYKDVSTTICTNPLIKRSEFGSSGDWNVAVEYVSQNAAGTSSTQTIRIK